MDKKNIATSVLMRNGYSIIPKKIRTFLELKPGDKMVFEFAMGQVQLRKATSFDLECLSVNSLEEWLSPEDEEAFRDL